TPFFHINKILNDCRDIIFEENYDLVFYDAFAPDIQPKLWNNEILNKFYLSLKQGGIFVTYSAKGHVRRALQECGFSIERLEGPPGKREILRATK
ncbi:MAG: SAM-dependent methyltransferase, partial [Bacteroidales bacterium]|nr:SAM-dependent methyltransferase [Bacteroidales bacterium]